MVNLTFDEAGHEYRADGVIVPSVNQILTEMGMQDYSKIPQQYIVPALKFGKRLHKLLELVDKGTLDFATAGDLIEYVEQWQVLRDGWKLIVNETPLYCKTWGYAGTPDRVFSAPGGMILVDIKTSAEIGKATALQFAGYDIALAERGIKINKWLIARARDGVIKPQEILNIETYRNVWRALMVTYNYKNGGKI